MVPPFSITGSQPGVGPRLNDAWAGESETRPAAWTIHSVGPVTVGELGPCRQ